MRESLMEYRDREAYEFRREERLRKEERFVEPSEKEVALCRKVQDGDHKDEEARATQATDDVPEVCGEVGKV